MKRISSFILALVLGLTALGVHAVESTGTATSKTFTSTTTEFPNPDRGWYQFGVDLQSETTTEVSNTFNAGMRLIFNRINLSAAVNRDLTQAELDSFTAGFTKLRNGGIKSVVRVAYNYDQSGTDATLAQAQRHMQQLAPILKANADVIYVVQLGLIGSYAEGWGSVTLCPSTSVTASCRIAVTNAVAGATDLRTFLNGRYVKYIIGQYPNAISAATRFSGSTRSRLGNHNDCFMSDNTDVGTYQSSVLTLANPERARVANDSEWTPYGGETCSGFSPQRLGCATGSGIMNDGPLYHLSYLNKFFFADFMNSWSSGGCYAQVERSMGYRLQLAAISHQSTAVAGQSITASVDMKNLGWGRVLSDRRLTLVLRNQGNGTLITCPSAMTLRDLPPNMSSNATMKIACTIPTGSPSGAYDVYLTIPDIYPSLAGMPAFMVRPANLDDSGNGQSWDAATGRFKTGTTLTL